MTPEQLDHLMTPEQLDQLIAGFAAGQPRSLARLISLLENSPTSAPRVLSRLPAPLTRAVVVGLTGSPGSGKSTVAAALVGVLRSRGERVAVIGVDPSSPFGGGALLGDRIRLREHAADHGVFIRSMATRGMLGGLAIATWQAVTLLERFGFPWVLVETVGVGQSEVDIASLADVTVLLLAPGMGDGIQVMKAGVMEIADLFLVNKADQDGADRTLREVRAHLNVWQGPAQERPPVLTAVATKGTGIDELLAAIKERIQAARANGRDDKRRRQRIRYEIDTIVSAMVQARIDVAMAGDKAVDLWRHLEDGTLDTYSAACGLLERITGTTSNSSKKSTKDGGQTC